MTRTLGQDVRAYYASRDVSDDINSISLSLTADAKDVTVFQSAGWKENVAGLRAWSADINGFYEPGSSGGGTIGNQVEALFGTSGGILSFYYDRADTVGDRGYLGSDSVLAKHGEPITVADVVKLQGTLTGHGKPGMLARLLHPLGVASASGGGSAYDGSASSLSGGRANLHVVSATGGPWIVKVQHGADTSTWVDLITFTSSTNGNGHAETIETTAVVQRYLRAKVESDGSTAGSINYVLGFARY